MSIPDTLQILLIEDNADHADMILRHVKRSSRKTVRAQHTQTLAEGLDALREASWDAVLLDLQLPDSNGLDTLARVITRSADLPVIVLTSLGDEELATKALRRGAQDYLVKDDFTTELLSRAVRYAIERKRIEDRLRKSLETVTEHAFELEKLNRKLEEQNRDLDEFNHMVSHDLREPIRHLLVFGQRLRTRVAPELADHAIQDLLAILGAAHRMEKSIAGLQILSQTSRQEMERIPVALESCVSSALVDLDGLVQEKGAVVTWGDLPKVVGDPALLVLLFRHLISNSIKYCENEPVVRITGQQEGGHSVLGVSDNGIGVDPRYAERVFTPFRRLHARSEFGGGTGLGLAICRKIVERHGGRIWVEPNDAGGAHFRFTLNRSVPMDSQSLAPDSSGAVA